MTNLDLDKVRKLTRRYDEMPPVEIRPPRWYHRPSVWILLFILVLAFFYLALADGAEDPAKPHFSSTLDKLITTLDLTYCWSAVFTNRTTGLSHTLTTAKDKNGAYCDRGMENRLVVDPRPLRD